MHCCVCDAPCMHIGPATFCSQHDPAKAIGHTFGIPAMPYIQQPNFNEVASLREQLRIADKQLDYYKQVDAIVHGGLCKLLIQLYQLDPSLGEVFTKKDYTVEDLIAAAEMRMKQLIDRKSESEGVT